MSKEKLRSKADAILRKHYGGGDRYSVLANPIIDAMIEFAEHSNQEATSGEETFVTCMSEVVKQPLSDESQADGEVELPEWASCVSNALNHVEDFDTIDKGVLKADVIKLCRYLKSTPTQDNAVREADEKVVQAYQKNSLVGSLIETAVIELEIALK